MKALEKQKRLSCNAKGIVSVGKRACFANRKLGTENKKTATSFWKLKSLGDKNGRYFEEKNTPIFFKKKERETENNCSDGVGEPQTKYGKKRNGRVVKLSPINKSGGLGRQNGKKYDAKHTCDKWGIYISAM